MPRPRRPIPSLVPSGRRPVALPTAPAPAGPGWPDSQGERAIVPTAVLSLALGALPTVVDADGAPGIPSATAFDLPAASGHLSFEIPADLAGSDVILILSATATGGPFAAHAAMTPGSGDGASPDLRALGTILDLAAIPRLPPDAEVGTIGVPSDRPLAPGRPPLRRAFAVQVRPGDPAVPSNYDLVDARLRAVGERIQVFVDEDDGEIVSDDALRALVSAFDRAIEPTLAGWVGTPTDVDGDGRFAVLLSRRVPSPFAGRCHVDGYFRPADLDAGLPRPLSNRADLVYLNADLPPGPYLETVLAHEYAHAVLASRRRERPGPAAEESWIDEAMAHLCEDRVGRSTMNLDYRVGAFLADPGRYRLVVDEEHRPGLFRSHGNRGASYLFLRWCAGAIGADLPRALASSGLVGAANLERAAGLPFAELHRRWTIAMALASLGLPDGGRGGLELHDDLGGWPLGGLRFVAIGADEPPASFAIEGTGTQYLRCSTRPDGPTRIVFRCDPASTPRVTALLVGPGLPRLTLDLDLVDVGPESASLVARVEEHAGLPVRLDRLSWEPLVPAPDRPRPALQSHQIRGDELTSLFPDPALAAGSRATSRPLTVPLDALRDRPLVFRLSALGEGGLPVVAWAELGLTQALATALPAAPGGRR